MARQDRRDYLREYQREWIAKRRADWIAANGPCRSCGSTDALEVDHIVPSMKSVNPSWCWSWSLERRQVELAKCRVLCHDCHLAKTLNERPKAQHGTLQMYQKHACRCSDCRAAKMASKNKYKEAARLKPVVM